MCKVTITLEGQVKGLNPITRPLSVQLIIAVDVQRAHSTYMRNPATATTTHASATLSLTWYNIWKYIREVTLARCIHADIEEQPSEAIKVEICKSWSKESDTEVEVQVK